MCAYNYNLFRAFARAQQNMSVLDNIDNKHVISFLSCLLHSQLDNFQRFPSAGTTKNSFTQNRKPPAKKKAHDIIANQQKSAKLLKTS